MEAVHDQTAVREQLERVLGDPLFRNSRRSKRFLEFVVGEVLEGRERESKERTVGVSVFDRDVEYDTNLDHVVRTAATDLRRRLALYYQQPAHHGELRIVLPSGSYAPMIETPDPEPRPSSEAKLVALAQTSAAPVAVRRSPRRRMAYAVVALLLAASVVVAFLVARQDRGTNLDALWKPFLDSSDPVLLCVGTLFVPQSILKTADESPTKFSRYLLSALSITVASGDSDTVARLAGLLRSKGKQFRVRVQTSSTLSDLRQGPAVLVGAFNNGWSVRLTDKMRYALVWEEDGNIIRIKDRRHPDQQTWKQSAVWSTEPGLAQLKHNEDFALVSRVSDPTTGRQVLIAGGLTMMGTVAAGEFLSNSEYLQQFAASLPKGWEHKNLQFVISTQLIGGDSGPPRIQAVECS